MDERFTMAKQAPPSALRQINAGRLKGKTDINPQWKIECMTEIYGMCGIGWKYEVVDKIVYPTETKEVLIYMTVNVYIKDSDGQWSAPIVGFGGDYIVKKERDGLRCNDEAYKMCLTDALGNALKNLGVANDIFRGLWDGSKYAKIDDEAQTKVANGEQPDYVKVVDGKTCVLGRGGSYVALDTMSLEQLNYLTNDRRFASCHDEARRLMSHMG